MDGASRALIPSRSGSFSSSMDDSASDKVLLGSWSSLIQLHLINSQRGTAGSMSIRRGDRAARKRAALLQPKLVTIGHDWARSRRDQL